MSTEDEDNPPAASAGHAALAAAGEAAALFAGAPIAGAAEAAVGLGDMVSGEPSSAAPVRRGLPWGWIAMGVVVIAALVWALKG